MPSGGKRPGAGRKRIIRKPVGEVLAALHPGALTSTIQPKEVMLNIMRHHYERQEFQLAGRMAVAVAPYIHPRLSSLEVDASGAGAAAMGGPLDLAKAETLEVVRRLAFVMFLAGRQQAANDKQTVPAVVTESKSA